MPADIEQLTGVLTQEAVEQSNVADCLPQQPPNLLARWVELEKERRASEERAEACKKEQNAIQELLLDEWVENNQQSASIGGFTVYIAHEFFCSKRSGFTTEQVIEALDKNGLSRLVSTGYNSAGLKAHVNEQVKAGSDLPEDLQRCLNYDSIPRLRARLA
jgi:hypothetical protein